MTVVASSIFRMIQFPHLGKIVNIDQLDFCTPYLHGSHASNVLFIDGSSSSYESVGVRLLKDSSLMGAFPSSPPTVASVNMITSLVQQSQDSFDPWVVLDPSTVEFLGDAMPLSIAKEQYVAIQAASDTPSCDESNLATSDSLLNWLKSTPSSLDHFLKIFLSEKSIL